MLVLEMLIAAVTILDGVTASPASSTGGLRHVARKAALPVAKVGRAEAILPRASTNGTQTITVKSGDTLGKLAPQFGVGICDIAKASNIANPNALTPGQTLTIPPPTTTPDNTSCLPPAAPPASARCVTGGPDRLVVPADGLSAQLAAKFLNITLDSFAAANPLAFAASGNGSAEALGAINLPGMSILTVPVCPNSQCTISQGTVQSGDNFDAIAAAAGSTTGQILMLNPVIDRLNLEVGQTFTLPSDCRNLTSNAANSSAVAA